MTKWTEIPIYERLRELRERAGLSRDALAKAIGLKGSSSYQRYETADYKKKYISVEMAENISKAICGKGNPPITHDEVMNLSGVKPASEDEQTRHLSSYTRTAKDKAEDIDMFLEADPRPLLEALSSDDRMAAIDKVRSSKIIDRDILISILKIVSSIDPKSIDMKKVPLEVIFSSCIATHDFIASSEVRDQRAIEDLAKAAFIKTAHAALLAQAGFFKDLEDNI